MSDDEGFRKKLRHDLRTPLSVVLGRAEILLSELHGPLSPEQRRSVEDIVRHALRMNVELTALAEQYDDLRGRGDPG